jgi:Kdo2-lipid IVA lauroyltransferase/acyltransferase
MALQSKSISDRLLAFTLRGAISVLRWLGPTLSSDLGGWVARTVGPFLPASRTAHANLRRALPTLDAAQRNQVVRQVWDNLGRTSMELTHLGTFTRTDQGPGWELVGEEHIVDLRTSGRQVLFFSGHFGNWEMILPIATQLGLTVSGFYRAASNKAVNDIIQNMRQQALGPNVSMFAKGAHGAREALLHLQRGGSLGLLVDQKMNDGISVPFLGQSAMTAPALALFALRFHCPVVPVRVVRLGPARFRLVCEPALAVSLTGNKPADVYALSLAMNATLERWVRADPGTWLWLHRRWPKQSTESRISHQDEIV